jgi:hypothetical protein
MLRVHTAKGQFEDHDANLAQATPSGALLISRVEFREVRDPSNLTAPPTTQVSNPQLVAIIAAGCWTRVDNLDLSEPDPLPALASTNGGTLQ